MAYPTVDKPYGLKPVNLIGGQVFAGSTRLMEIQQRLTLATEPTFFMVTWSNVLLVERLRKTQEQRPQPHPVCSWDVSSQTLLLVNFNNSSSILQAQP